MDEMFGALHKVSVYQRFSVRETYNSSCDSAQQIWQRQSQECPL
jgi:hypothetical protein